MAPKSVAAQINFDLLFENHPLPTWIYDSNSLFFLEVNTAAVNKYGYSREKFLSMIIDDIRETEIFDEIKEKISKKGNSFKQVNRWEHKLKSGKNISVEVSSNKISFKGSEVVLETSLDITDQKRAEEALRESEQRFQVLAGNSPVGIFQTDAKGSTLYVNQRWCQISGLSKEEAIGDGWLNAVHKEDQEKLSIGWRKATKTNETSHAEYRFVNKDGTIVWVIGQAIPERNNRNKIIGYIGTITDITEQKILELQLKNRLELEKIVSDISSKFINIPSNLINYAITEALGMVGKFASVDRSYMFLFTDDGSFMDNTHEWCAEGIEPQIDNLKELPVSILPWWMSKLNNFETIYIPRVSELPIEANNEKEILESQDIKSVIVIPVIYNNTLLGFLGFDSVVSEKIWVDEDMLLLRTLSEIIISALNRGKFESTLQESEQRLRNIIEHSTNLFFSHDTNHVLTYLSPQIKDLLGYEVKEAMRKWTELTSNNQINEIGFQKTVKAIESGVTQEAHELELVHKNGSKVWVEVREAPVVENGITIAIVGSINDITKRKNAEVTLKESEQRYYDIFKFAPVGIYQSTIDDCFITVNDKLVDILGYDSIDELIKQKIAGDIYFNADERSEFFAKIDQSRSVISSEILWKKKNGDRIWISHTSHSVKDESDSTIYFEGYVVDITEYKLAEQQIHESEKQLRKLVEGTKALLFTTDNRGRFTYINLAGSEAIGISQEQLLGSFYLRLVHPDDRKRVHQQYLNQLENIAESTYLEFRYLGKKSKVGWLSFSVNAIVNNGIVIGLTGVAQDITKRKVAEETLKESEKRYYDIFKFAPVGIYQSTIDSRFIKANDRLVYILGYESTDELMKKNIAKDIYYDEGERKKLIAKFEPIGSAFNHDLLWKKKNGDKIWISLTSHAVKDEFDNTLYFEGFVEDITDRKLAEETLKESENKFRTVVEEAVEIVFTADNRGYFTYINSAGIKASGYTIDELVKFRYSDLVETEHQHKVKLHYINQLRERKTLSTIEYPFRTKLGGIKWFNQNARLIIENDKIKGFYVIARDVTERRKAEEALRESEGKFRSLIESINEVFYITNKDGKITYCSPNISATTGFSQQEILGNSFLKLIAPIDRRLVLDKYVQMTAKGETDTMQVFRVRCKDGKIVWAEQITHLLRDSSGGIVEYRNVTRDITDRKNVEEALKESENKFRAVIEEAVEIVFTINNEGYFTYINPAGIKSSGYSLDELKKLKYIDLVEPKYKQRAKRNYFRQYVERRPLSTEDYPFCTKSGEVKWFNQNVRLIIENDEVKGFYVISRDITEQRKAEEALQESEKKFRSVWEKSTDGMRITNGDGIIISVNEAYCKLVKKPIDEIEGKPMSLVHQEVRRAEILRKHSERFRSGTIPSHSDTKIILWDGTEIYLELSNTFLTIENQPTLLLTVFRDITERKRAEESLQTSKNILEGIINSIPSKVFWKDKNLNYLGCNTGFARDAGFANPKEIIGKDDFQMGWRDQAELYRSDDRLVIESGRSKLLIEEPQTTPEGKIITLLTSKLPLRDSEGEIIGILGSYIDITERKQAEQELLIINKELVFQNEEKEKRAVELIIAKEKAEEMYRLKSSFLANMSHELRTPLNGIMGFADILSRELEAPELKEMAENIYMSGNRLSETLTLILDLSKFESEKMDFNYQKIDIVSETEGIITLFKGTVRKKELYIRSSFSHPSIFINTDQRAFRTILNNLVNNAIKFTAEGGVTADISLKDDFVEIKVNDTGIGIAKEYHQFIFEEFRQVSEGFSRNFDGTGLGLNITKNLVEKFGGEISVESELGKGSTFTIKLPVRSVGEKIADEKVIEKTAKKVLTPEIKSTKPLALLVDDDPDVYTILKRYVGGQVDLKNTPDGEFAIRLCMQKQYDLIFMDINLRRGMDGKQVTQAIRIINGYESIPIIATTAYAMVGDKEEFLAAGCSHYISKPFTQQDVLNLLEEIFSGK